MTIAQRLFMASALVFLASACESKVTGNEGNFQFAYPADDRVFDFNKPIAVGARLDLTVEDAGDMAAIQLEDVASDDPALAVVDFTGNRFTLEATAEGNVLIEVVGSRDGGESLKDSVNLNARVPDTHGLRHTCGEDGAVAYRSQTKAYVPFDMQMANGQPVIGYGYYPVAFSGGASLDVSHQGHQYMRLDLTEAGSHTVTSELDGSTLDLMVVDEADIDGVAEPVAFVLEDIDVGDRNAFYVLPQAGTRTVCQAIVDMTVTSDTPDICALRQAPSVAGDGTDAGKESGWFEMEGVSEGTCLYTVAYPNSGASAQFSYPIQP